PTPSVKLSPTAVYDPNVPLVLYRASSATSGHFAPRALTYATVGSPRHDVIDPTGSNSAQVEYGGVEVAAERGAQAVLGEHRPARQHPGRHVAVGGRRVEPAQPQWRGRFAELLGGQPRQDDGVRAEHVLHRAHTALPRRPQPVQVPAVHHRPDLLVERDP